MARYAEFTKVPIGRSRDEIERTLERYGAEQFAYGWEQGRAVIQFRAHDRIVKFELPLADLSDQEVRQRWRALVLVVKSKLESVENGIEEFEQAFLAQLVLPDGQTVGDWVSPQIAVAYESGRMPKLLPEVAGS